MRKLGIALALTLVFAPSALAQTPSQNANQNAMVKTCKNTKAQMGAKRFNQAFAPRTWSARAALRNCARKEATAQQQARVNAAQACKTWAAGEDTTGFEAVFGTGTSFATRFTGPNAHGKCVSTYARMQNQERRAATVNAAQICGAARGDLTAPTEAFADIEALVNESFAFFGPDKNAYGKCVSFVAKALQADEETTPTP
jgi:hypothetical protein